jgi:hypothetical protein
MGGSSRRKLDGMLLAGSGALIGELFGALGGVDGEDELDPTQVALFGG